MNLFSLVFTDSLLLHAVLAALLASIIGGLIGSFVVIKRMAFFSGSISHAILGGIGLALWLGRVHDIPYTSPLVGAILAALLAAWLSTVVLKGRQNRSDAVLTALWTAGMALGIIFISITPGYTADLNAYLIGNILWVSHADLLFLAALLAGTLFFIISRFEALKLSSFDPIEARLRGIRTVQLERILLLLVALSVVALIQVVGIVLVMSLLTLPQMISLLFVKRLSHLLISSSLISCFVTLSGIQLAITMDIPIGATIACFAALLFTGTSCIKRLRHVLD